MDEKNIQDSKLTIEKMILYELDGKGNAITAYDGILWKIRSGYAVFLYGSLSIIGASGKLETLGLKGYLAAGALVIGFTLSAILVDYLFLKCKFRVVDARDQLMDIAMKLITGKPNFNLSGEETLQELQNLSKLLHNSGESQNEVQWSKYSGIRPIYFLYLGTLISAITAILIMALWH